MTPDEKALRSSGAASLRPHLARGDLTCELSDAGLARAITVQWAVRTGGAQFAGPARTVDARGGDVAAVRAAASKAEGGEVLVVLADGVEGAVLGDRIGAVLHERGAAGVVVVGNVRDVPKLQRMGLPLVASGVVPSRAEATEQGRLNVELKLGSVTVAPGDLVVADPNGVVVVGAQLVAELPAFAALLSEPA